MFFVQMWKNVSSVLSFCGHQIILDIFRIYFDGRTGQTSEKDGFICFNEKENKDASRFLSVSAATVRPAGGTAAPRSDCGQLTCLPAEGASSAAHKQRDKKLIRESQQI